MPDIEADERPASHDALAARVPPGHLAQQSLRRIPVYLLPGLDAIGAATAERSTWIAIGPGLGLAIGIGIGAGLSAQKNESDDP